MTGPSKSSSIAIARQFSYHSVYVNPLNLNDDPEHDRSSTQDPALDNKENVTPNKKKSVPMLGDKENSAPAPTNGSSAALKKPSSPSKCLSSDKLKVLKPSSLQFCMQMNEPDSAFWSKFRDPIGSENSNSANIWDFSDSEAAPASSWSTLPNRTLLCRPLPMDIGRCTCVIVKEPSADGVNGGTLYSLYTNEGKGRQDRKLAVALCKRRNGKSIFTIAQSIKGVLSNADDSYIGAVTANLMGSKYHIWDQGICLNSVAKQSKTLLAVVMFLPTIATWTGSYRTMRAYIPKHQSMQLKSATHVQHINGLPKEWEERVDRVHQLVSRVPNYNKVSKQYELDFRDRGRAGLRIQRSVKNFQLKLEESGKQTILQLGRVEKSRYVMDYRELGDLET
ncbi:hypothetical protein CDL15_Pgr007926 [Punica granatum]|uniref:Tubby C-terminal domain-containing protein n=1 Tax=Punica granatum TaxID=22663 RepID=A0A218XAS6_PUNGR|nr:hypothetical protein CDL15_Pgr007926 [Punica granatum]